MASDGRTPLTRSASQASGSPPLAIKPTQPSTPLPCETTQHAASASLGAGSTNGAPLPGAGSPHEEDKTLTAALQDAIEDDMPLSPESIQRPPLAHVHDEHAAQEVSRPGAGDEAIVPDTGDGAFLRRPGHCWTSQTPVQTTQMVRSRSFSSTAGAAAATAATATSTVTSAAPQPSTDSIMASIQSLLSGRGTGTSANGETSTTSEDTPLTAGLTKLWGNLFKLAGAPDADGVVRPNGKTEEGRTALDKASEEDQSGIDVSGGAHGSKTIKSPLRRQDKWETPRLPVCFAHGLFGFDSLHLGGLVTISYWRGVVEALESNGCEVLVCRVPTSASIQDRAAALKLQIEERFAGREINLIAHSMGGLDSRYLASQLRPSFSIRTITTITTPHRGSAFADFMLDQVIGRERLPSLLSLCKAVGLPGGGQAFENLKRESMAEFNKRTPDNPGTKYFSWGARFTPSVVNEFRIPWAIIKEAEGENDEAEGENDGLVSVKSSQWGQYQGTLEGVNHLQIVGWRTGGPLTKLAFGQDSVFNTTSFYLQICEDLAREGF